MDAKQYTTEAALYFSKAAHSNSKSLNFRRFEHASEADSLRGRGAYAKGARRLLPRSG